MIKYVLKCVIIFIMILILGVLLLPLIKFNEAKEVNNKVYTAEYEVLNNEIGGNQYERILSII